MWPWLAGLALVILMAAKTASASSRLAPFEGDIVGSATLYNVPASWVRAVIMTESSGDPNAYRAEPQINDGSYGLMQLLLRTARGLGYAGTTAGLYDPATNIDLGTKLLRDLRRSYGTNFERVYSAYNSGNPDRYRTSTQVAANVARAVTWLRRLDGMATV